MKKWLKWYWMYGINTWNEFSNSSTKLSCEDIFWKVGDVTFWKGVLV